MENLDLYTEDSAELLVNPREGKSAIRERWSGFTDQLQFTGSDLIVREIIGMGDVAYAWIKFSNTYEADGEQWVQSGTWMVLFRRSPEGAWGIHRNMWNATTSADTTGVES
jgi:ketosteroid isomerase-like protein